MTDQQSILLIEDDAQIPRVLRHPLSAAGFELHLADNVDTGLAAIAETKPDIVLLDLSLGDQDGKTVIRSAREWSDVPIIVLSARDAETEKVAALDEGADDYVNKPFGISELLFALRFAAAQTAARGNRCLASATWTMNFVDRRVSWRDAPIALTPREYDALRLLAQHAGQVVTHRQIMEGAWRQDEPRDYQHVRVVIGQLRKKLDGGADAPLIFTEQGVGYRLRLDE